MGLDIRRPNLFIVGTMKGGTTSLAAHLSRHPAIDFCVPKEPNFFGESGSRHNGGMSIDEYEALFQHHRGKYSGEATVKYLYSLTAASEIYEYNPGSRIIITLRNPIDRAYSHYWHHRKSGAEPRSFESAVRAEIASASSQKHVREDSYLGVSRYGIQLRRYLAVFDRSAVHVLLTEEMASEPSESLSALARWLDIAPDSLPPQLPHLNPSGVLRLPWLRTFLTTNPLIRRAAHLGMSQGLRTKAILKLDDLLVSKRRTPPMSPEVRILLREYFAADVRSLQEDLGLDTRAWSDWR